MGESFTITFDATHTAIAIRVHPHVSPDHALAALRLPEYAGVLVVHGGAGQMDDQHMEATQRFLIDSISPLAEKHRLLIIDGGTLSGAAQVLGDARAAINGSYSLVGVVPEDRVSYPGGPSSSEVRIALDGDHSHFILVQGPEFGDESSLLVGMLRAVRRPGAALVINGGEIVLAEAQMHVTQGNPIITLDGSGRLADQLAQPASSARQQLPESAQLYVVNVTDPQGCIDLLNQVLNLPA